MRIILCLLLCLTSLTAKVCIASTWLEQLNTNYEKLVGDKLQSKEEKKTLSPLPTGQEKSWHYEYYQEEIFNSKIVVLQAGMEHKRTILLVHGLGERGMAYWYSVIPHLAKNYHVIAFDLPGFGHSEKPSGRYTPTNYAKVVSSVVKSYARKNLTVIGHSMGGAVSIKYAANSPEKVKRLILVGVAGVLHKTAFIKHSTELPSWNLNSVSFLDTKLAQFNDFSASFIERLSESAFSQGIENSDVAWQLIKTSHHLNAAFSLLSEDLTLSLANIEAQTFIIWGDEDNVAPLRTAKALNNSINGSRLAVIEGAAHVPMSTHIKEFIEVLDKSLTGDLIQENPIQPPEVKGDLNCTKESGKTYTGVYELVVIKNCNNVLLKNFTATKLIISNSLVSAENVIINSAQSAVTISESVLRVTNAVIRTKAPIELSGSRLDLASVKISSPERSINVDASSTLTFSVSWLENKYYQGHIHGYYKLKRQALSSILTKAE